MLSMVSRSDDLNVLKLVKDYNFSAKDSISVEHQDYDVASQ